MVNRVRSFNSGKGKKKEFYETHGDVRSVSKFIEQFLARYNRRNRTRHYLQVKSYGTARSALLAGELMGAGPEKADTMGIEASVVSSYLEVT